MAIPLHIRRFSPAFLTLTPRSPLPQRKPIRPRCTLTITSPQNPRIKAVKQLLRRRQRDKEGMILLEGPRLITDALTTNAKPIELFHTPSTDNSTIIDTTTASGGKVTQISEQIFRTISDTVNPQGVIAIFQRPTTPLPILPSLTLVCDNIRDPGNLGTLLRSAAGAGVDSVLLTTGCADVWSLKTLRSGMGAQFRLPLKQSVSWQEIEKYLQGMEVYIADGAGDTSYADINWCARSALIVGSEADGPSAEAFLLGKGIRIEMNNMVESLNAAMAGTVILFEASRQRLQGLRDDLEPKIYRD